MEARVIFFSWLRMAWKLCPLETIGFRNRLSGVKMWGFSKKFFDGGNGHNPSYPYISYCWWTKSCNTKDDDYPIIYRVLTIPGGAGFCPSTVTPAIHISGHLLGVIAPILLEFHLSFQMTVTFSRGSWCHGVICWKDETYLHLPSETKDFMDFRDELQLDIFLWGLISIFFRT